MPDLMPEDASRHQGYMGRSFYEYNGDQRFLGKVADFRIYNTALDQAQVTTLQTEIEDMLSSLDQNDFEASDIELTEEMCLAAGDTKDKVTKNLTLPTEVTITGKQKKGIVKTWTSDNTAAITNAGVVTQSDTTETVHLTASVHLEGNEENTKDKVLTFKVPRLLTDQEVLDEAAKNLTIPNSSDLRGNITLPTEVPTEDSTTNATIAWTSSNENIINTKANGKIPAGVVTRPKDKDEKVTLTATMTYKGITKQKEIACTVRKAYEMPETTDYLFAYFPYTSFKDERIYFGISEDGLNFNSLNNGNFVLESKLGTHGLRDPFIIRSPEGDKFYLIATDLTVAGLTQDDTFYPGMGWSENQRNGSKYIMVWESNDLVNWSDQRMCRVALDEAGCTWAPEAFWDDATQQYIVFWASMVNGKHHVYYATTRDFYTFSEPVNWIEEAGSVIDTTMIKIGDWYYRFSKNEADTANRHGTPGKHVYCERSKSLTATTESGEWELVHENSMAINGGIEGPCVYKLNNDDIENAKRLAGLKNINLTGNDIYCLINDNYGKTIIPGLSDNIAEGSFAALGSNAIEEVDGVKIYSMPEPVSSHGTIMPITSEEYDNLMKKYDTTYRNAAKQLTDKISAAEKSLESTINTSSPIKENLALPTSADGVTITWASSNEAVILANGTVTRPEYGKGNASVTLTATITAAGNDTVRTQVKTKTFTCTVAEKEKPIDQNPPTGDKPVNYTVTFSSAGGSSVAAQTVESGKKATTPKNPTRKKYTFDGWYLGSKKYDFNTAVTGNITLTARWTKVKVGAPKISKLQNKKSKQCIVTFKKVSGAKGYRISYTTDKKFKKGIKHVSAKSTKATIKKLKKNKTYYFKVQAYKLDSTKSKIYGKYSSAKKIKIKK